MNASTAVRREADRSIDAHPVLAAIARHAIASLHAELVLSPKPGLVCPGDPGAHDDMDARTMMRSLFALRHGFVRMTVAAADGAHFERLQAIGVEAEAAMRRATGGVNTHRGAIFALGLLASSAAACVATGVPITDRSIRETVVARWGRALRLAGGLHPVVEATHGRQMAMRHGAGGARREAADGFPTVFGVVLPALRAARARGHDERRARLHALMASIAVVDDTNLLYRGGRDGLRRARALAARIVVSGGCDRPDFEASLIDVGRAFVAERLSPGGSADLLAAALFVDRVVAPAGGHGP